MDINSIFFFFRNHLKLGAGTMMEVATAGKHLIVVSNATLMAGHQDELAAKFNSMGMTVIVCDTFLAPSAPDFNLMMIPIEPLVTI